MIKNQIDIAIIGGGLAGMLTAYALNKAGAKVMIIEKSASASESSWAGGGILSPLYPWRYPEAVNVLSQASQRMYPSLVDEISEISGIDPEYRQCGMHILSEELDSAAIQWMTDHNVMYENSQPLWHQNAATNFVYLPEIAQIRNPRFIKSLKLALEKTGVQFSFNNSVESFSKDADNCFSLLTSEGAWQAEKIVVCAGAWTSRLLGDSVLSVDINPVRGQMLLYKAPASLISSIILARGKYIIPRNDGRVLVGSTMEYVGFDKSNTEEGIFVLKQFVADMCPCLADYPIEKQWAGLRPGSPDGTPYIGEHPLMPGLYVNSGHFRNGVVMAPASASLMCDLIQDNQTDINPIPYSLAYSFEK